MKYLGLNSYDKIIAFGLEFNIEQKPFIMIVFNEGFISYTKYIVLRTPAAQNKAWAGYR